MATSGQTLNDRINAARYALAGQGLARCVCKATTEEIIGPKKKHLDYLLACTHEPNVSIPQLANLLIERANHIYWVVVFKALVTVHHLMSYGNERFIQYLASSNYSLELSTFVDKTAARDFSMSTYIRRYSAYINEKALSYRLLAFDFCKVKRGNEGVLRLMPIDRLLKTLPILHKQLNALLEFNCSANDLNNGVINACFMLLFRDLIGLFACYNDGIINLLDKYFTLNRKMCREALDLYNNFLKCMDRVSEFLRVAEVVGIDKDEIPDLRRAPSSLVEALEEHLQNIESNKKILKQSGTSVKSTAAGASTGDKLEFSLLGKSATAGASTGDRLEFSLLGKPAATGASTGDRLEFSLLGKSAAAGASNGDRLEFSLLGNLTPPSANRPSSPNSGTANVMDDEVRKALEEEARVLSQYGGSAASNGQTTAVKAVDPFSDAADTAFAFSPPQASTVVQPAVDAAFDPAPSTANYTNLGGFDNFGDLLQPMSASGKAPVSSSSSISSSKPLASTGLFKGDLDSTLANLAQNLTFDGISKTKK